MALSRERVLELQRRGLRDWIATLARSSEGARMVERNGVSAAIVPACSTRSIPNSVSYFDPAELLDSLDDLASAYADAGIEAWTVWVPEFARSTVDALERAGHAFDGHPAAMALELGRFEPAALGDLDWDTEVSGEDFGRVNDLAYGITERGYAPSLVTPPGDLRRYQARVDGEVACVLATMDHDGDLGFYFVATDPRVQGRGLASRLMSAALIDARERGMRTSSLQASGMGEPVYRRLGYEVAFRLHLYERRVGGS